MTITIKAKLKKSNEKINIQKIKELYIKYYRIIFKSPNYVIGQLFQNRNKSTRL